MNKLFPTLLSLFFAFFAQAQEPAPEPIIWNKGTLNRDHQSPHPSVSNSTYAANIRWMRRVNIITINDGPWKVYTRYNNASASSRIDRTSTPTFVCPSYATQYWFANPGPMIAEEPVVTTLEVYAGTSTPGQLVAVIPIYPTITGNVQMNPEIPSVRTDLYLDPIVITHDKSTFDVSIQDPENEIPPPPDPDPEPDPDPDPPPDPDPDFELPPGMRPGHDLTPPDELPPGVPPAPTPQPPYDPLPPAPPLPGITGAIEAMDEAARLQRQQMIDLLEAIEQIERDRANDDEVTLSDARHLSDWAVGNLPADITSEILASYMPGVMEDVKRDVSRPTVPIAMPTDSSVAGATPWIINIGLGGDNRNVDLNPLTNSKTAPLILSFGQWVKAILMAIVIITGTSMLYERYYEAFRDLVAARGSFRMGIGAQVNLGDVMTAIAGTVAAVVKGAMTAGAGALAVGGLLGGAMAKFFIPTAIHIGFFTIALAPAFISIASQGLISGLPFSTTNTSAAPGSGLGGNMLETIMGIPGFANNGLAIVGAFVPIAFIVTYWISYLITSRILRVTTSYAMWAQAIIGKS